jgi:benzoate membrane transport protein
MSIAALMGLLHFDNFQLELAIPVWTTPTFSLAATISIGIPLFIVAMASQNMPGIAVLRTDGYQTPASPLLSVTGIASVLLAPFGSHGINLAAISAAICTGPEAHENPEKRYTAAVWCGVFYGIAGTFGATLAALFSALPKELVLSIAALALLGSIMNGLSSAMSDPKQREAALVTFLVTASGMTLVDIGSAFWGLIAGLTTQIILGWKNSTSR